jgi:uncharacterized protein YndB with AHSA1/START domain
MKTPVDQRDEAEREIVVSRAIEGPRLLVFEACSDARHLDRWWGPDGFSTTTHSFEFRRGGIWDFTMHGPDGTDYPNWVKWIEIDPPERLVLLHGATEDDPEAFVSTLTLVEQGEQTLVTLRSVFDTKEQRDRVVEEYHAIDAAMQTLGALGTYVTTPIGQTSEGAS